MRFKITLETKISRTVIPINYQYPLSSAIYTIIAKGDVDYASFLHNEGYGKGFKLFTFSDISCPFKIEGDRLYLKSRTLTFEVAFHMPEALESFVKGLFQSENIDIADSKSRASFIVKSVESLPDPLLSNSDSEIVKVILKPLSPIVCGLKNEKGNYDYIGPNDERFKDVIIFNWRNKIKSCYGDTIAEQALLLVEVVPMEKPPRSRLITIKGGQAEETKIRGWMNFHLLVTAEKRFVSLLLNSGAGLSNAQGMGYLSVEK